MERGKIGSWEPKPLDFKCSTHRQGNLTEAISDYAKAIEIDPKDAEAYYNRGVDYYTAKEYDKAWIDVHKAEKLGYAVHPEFLAALKQASGKDK